MSVTADLHVDQEALKGPAKENADEILSKKALKKKEKRKRDGEGPSSGLLCCAS